MKVHAINFIKKFTKMFCFFYKKNISIKHKKKLTEISWKEFLRIISYFCILRKNTSKQHLNKYMTYHHVPLYCCINLHAKFFLHSLIS